MQALVMVILFGKLMRYIFFGQLRALEMEVTDIEIDIFKSPLSKLCELGNLLTINNTYVFQHLIEKSWYAVTETCLAFTVFRDDFSPRFVALFTLLLFIKCFHWLVEDRVDYVS